MEIPFFRPSIGEEEIAEVVDALRSGWLTTGPKTRLFERRFAEAVGAKHAVALSSCTAALHLALEALGVKPGDKVLTPTMTFAATAEVVRYLGADPIFIDCVPDTLHLDLDHAEHVARELNARGTPPVGILPVHVAGRMVDLDRVSAIARAHGAWVVDDAAHAFPAARRTARGETKVCGSGDADVSCFSFYANKTITTGEGGMATTQRDDLAARMRVMSLHGMARDEEHGAASWDYDIIAPGFKYNQTDIASAIGLHQLDRAIELRDARARLARRYSELLAGIDEIELPPADDGLSSHHLYFIRLKLERLTIDRAGFVARLRELGVATSVHWKPLHLHSYYAKRRAAGDDPLPNATAVWPRLITLPLFPSMREEETAYVAEAIERLAREHRRRSP